MARVYRCPRVRSDEQPTERSVDAGPPPSSGLVAPGLNDLGGQAVRVGEHYFMTAGHL
jgi:hypothetical protein